MITENLDVVYFVKAYPSNDLKYSIRSVAKNLEFNKLWIYGGKKYEIKPDGYVRIMNQKGATKWDKVRNMYSLVCQNDEITEDFILFHDDFFVLKPIKSLDYEYRCSFEEHIKKLKEKYGYVPPYAQLLIEAKRLLEKENKTTYSYELHTPFIFNRKKLLKILRLYPKAHCIRSIYANYYEVGGKKANDVKIKSLDYKKINEVMNDWDFVSTSDVSFENGNIGRYLKDKFKIKSRFEL